jgi:H+/Cl- antiporter ClcA
LTERPGIISRFSRSEIAKTTDSCSVCQEEVNFFGMYHHMKTHHPNEFLAWILWAAGVVLAAVLPIAGMVLSLMMFGLSGALPLLLIFLLVLIVAQIVVGRFGKAWEMRVNEEWRAAHPVSRSTKPKRGRRG